MKDLQHFERVEAYVEGQMETAEKAQFEKELKEDETLQQEYDAYLVSSTLMDRLAYDQLRQKAKAVEQKEKSRRQVFLKRITSIAAAVLLLMSIAAFWYTGQRFSDQALLAKYSETLNIDLIRDRGNLEKSYDEAVRAFQKKDLNAAINRLESIPSGISIYPKVQYFLANLYLNTDQFDQAISTFQALLQKNDTRYTENVEWHLIMAYLQKGDREKLDTELKKLLSQPDHPYYNKALSLQRDLNRFWRKLN